MISHLKNGKKVAGLKQTRKAVEAGQAAFVVLAEDADPVLISPIEALCCEKGVPVERCPSMKELGALLGISVGAAAAAALKK